jgi:hypothetical protein
MRSLCIIFSKAIKFRKQCVLEITFLLHTAFQQSILHSGKYSVRKPEIPTWHKPHAGFHAKYSLFQSDSKSSWRAGTVELDNKYFYKPLDLYNLYNCSCNCICSSCNSIYIVFIACSVLYCLCSFVCCVLFEWCVNLCNVCYLCVVSYCNTTKPHFQLK